MGVIYIDADPNTPGGPWCNQCGWMRRGLVKATHIMPAWSGHGNGGEYLCHPCYMDEVDSVFDQAHSWRLDAMERLREGKPFPRFEGRPLGWDFVGWTAEQIALAGGLLDVAYGITPPRGRKPTSLGKG